jgi:hypothetical protein
MALKVYTAEKIADERKANSEKVKTAMIFAGSRFENAKEKGTEVGTRVELKENTAEMDELRFRVLNSANAPSAADLEALIGRFFIDVTRKVLEAPDLTGLIAQEITDINLPEIVYLRDVLPFRGVMGTIQGTNDAVPLIEQNTGTTDTMSLEIKAIGWKDNLKNMLYNSFASMDKVVQAAVNADVDERNKATVGAIVGATYAASQAVAADVTAGQSLDQHTYNTFVAADKKIRGLKDLNTKRKISVPRLSVLCNSQDTFQIERVIRGQLQDNGGGATGNVAPALPIANLIEYDQGINDGFTVGKTTYAFPGVTAGKCYLFVPGVMIVANKRPLTMETGNGSVLELSTEERAWYRVQGTYLKAFLGSSFAGTSIGAGYGYIVEITLPTA